MTNNLEAKIVVVGAQGVGKTCLVNRYVKNAFHPPSTTSTVGASFLTKRVVDADTSTVVRLQIWDTAGQERFHSITRLYYRGANAAIVCFDITDYGTFAEMDHWLRELRAHLGDDAVLHVVGTKADLVAADPARRAVPFERCIAYVADALYPDSAALQKQRSHGSSTTHPGPGPAPSQAPELSFSSSTATLPASVAASAPTSQQQQPAIAHRRGRSRSSLPPRSPPPTGHGPSHSLPSLDQLALQHPASTSTAHAPSSAKPNSSSPSKNPAHPTSSLLWTTDFLPSWTCAHEVSASSGDGVDEVFRVLTAKLVAQAARRAALQRAAVDCYASSSAAAAGVQFGPSVSFGRADPGYFDLGQPVPGGTDAGTPFRAPDKRRGWWSVPVTPGSAHTGWSSEWTEDGEGRREGRGRCC